MFPDAEASYYLCKIINSVLYPINCQITLSFYVVYLNRKVVKMTPKLFLIIIAFVMIFFSCGKDDNGPTSTENKPEGQWLKYWSGAQPARLNLSVKYYCVRFTKPANWESLSIDSIKIVAANSGQIKSCFWSNYDTTANQYWPVDLPSEGQTKSVEYGGNKWNVSSNNWTTNQAEFFVGFEQVGSAIILCGDGQCQPENRSYRKYSNSNWEQELGMFANYCIDVHVVKKSK